jgi:hypothetical protein
MNAYYDLIDHLNEMFSNHQIKTVSPFTKYFIYDPVEFTVVIQDLTNLKNVLASSNELLA